MRFGNFEKPWDKTYLSTYLTVSSLRNKDNIYTRNDVLSVSGELGIVNQIELLGRSYAGESLLPYHIVEKDDVVYTKSPLAEYPYGIIKTNRKVPGIVSTLYAVYKPTTTANNRFVEHYFSLKSRTNNYLKPIVRIGAKHDMKIGNEEVLKNYVVFPAVEEQTKIADFLDLLDERISTQSKIINNLESLIKGIRQRIFSASNFDIHNSKEYELGSFLSEYSKKNIENKLISVSVGKYGIRRRDEIYSKELCDDYSKNKVIEKNSLIIGMGSTQIDIGILSKDEKYCVSPAYSTYKISGINSDYLREYLIHLNSLLSKRYMVIGARQGKSVNKSELMQHVLLVHSIEKQLKIVDIFNVFYDKLQKEKDILSLYKKQKAYLLGNMFI